MKLWFILKDVWNKLYNDLSKEIASYNKPRELLGYLFFFIVAAFFLERYIVLFICIGLYIIIYIWKVLRSKDWKHEIRESYKKD